MRWATKGPVAPIHGGLLEAVEPARGAADLLLCGMQPESVTTV
jgi:hypothetical protein